MLKPEMTASDEEHSELKSLQVLSISIRLSLLRRLERTKRNFD